jgi:hypothetical protein
MANPGEFVLDSDGALMSVGEGPVGSPGSFQAFNANGKTLHYRYTVTFSGLGGDFAQFNGDNVVVYIDHSWGRIHWWNQDGFSNVFLDWVKISRSWKISIHASYECSKAWWSGPDAAPCDPSAPPYDVSECWQDGPPLYGCADETTCESSEGAIVTVSHGVPQ